MFQMWTISQIVCLVILIGLSMVDIHCHKVPVDVLIAGNIFAVLYQIYKACSGEAELWQIAGGVGVGLLFLLISKVTREGIGYGDSWGILSLGIYMGFVQLMAVLAGALFALMIASVIVLCVKKMSRTYCLPFFPFLTIGYAMGVINVW